MIIRRLYDSLESRFNNMLMEYKSIKIRRHIVVFESDDWGSIRMPSLVTREILLNKGLTLGSPQTYDYYDTLASNSDIENLAEILLSVKDINGNPAKITMNYCMANPDFDKIRDSDFSEYFYEPFTETLKKYPHHDKSYDICKKGIQEKIFKPQFHGREHLNALKWLNYLQNGNREMVEAFRQKFFSIKVQGDRMLPAYDISNIEEQSFVSESIREGLNMFESLFGFRSLSMIAPCYTWDVNVEKTAHKYGVKTIQGGYRQIQPKVEKKRSIYHYMGEKNKYGQIYLTRNCYFEPTQDKAFNGENCFRQIEKQFKASRPAVVSCHRLNFIGDLVSSNRDNNLKDFKMMLDKLLSKHPDVIFMSSDELGKLYE